MIADWTTETLDLYNQIKQWAQTQEGWNVRLLLHEDTLPASQETSEHAVLRLTIPYADAIRPEKVRRKSDAKTISQSKRDDGEIHFEPVGRKPDGSFVVEMYAWPTLVRVRLVHKPGNASWDVVTDAGLSFHWDWNAPTFVRLAKEMLSL